MLDARSGEMRLSHGGRSVVTRESLSELTTAVAMSRCDDKRHTRRILARAGLDVPAGREATFDDGDHTFLAEVGEVVVKPARGEQGAGITVGVTTGDELDAALAIAREHCADVLIEQRVPGDDLRIVVIDDEVVAAAVRRPAQVVGTGRHTVRDLVEAQSRRRRRRHRRRVADPLDDETARTVEAAGRSLDVVLPEGERLPVRRTANLHTGGTIHDVTADLHPRLASAAVAASRAIGIPVTGLDMIVEAVDAARRRFHRGQRAARPGQPRAPADGRALRRPAVPGHPGVAVGMAARASGRGRRRWLTGTVRRCPPCRRSTSPGCSTCCSGCCGPPARRAGPTR